MTIKVIVTDMDGTFLDDAKKYDRARFMAQYQELKKRDIEFVVPVSANLNFKSEGQSRDMEVWGNFWSGEGHYMLIPIQSITGNFHNKGRHLSFSDVKVNTKITTITTDALRIDDGQLTMGPLNITSHGGSNFILYDESFDEIDENMTRIKDGMKQAKENSKSASESAKGIDMSEFTSPDMKESIKDLKRSIDSAKDSLDNLSKGIKQ